MVIMDPGQADRLFRARRSPIPAKAIAHREPGRAQWAPHRRGPRHGSNEVTDETVARDPETEACVRAVPPSHRLGVRGGGGDGLGGRPAGGAGGAGSGPPPAAALLPPLAAV